MDATRQLVEALRALTPDSIVNEAIKFAIGRHAGQMRLDGEPYVNHLLRVGIAVARYAREQHPELAVTLAVCGVLHDTLEDTPTTDAELVRLFGEEVARTVRAVSHVEEEEPESAYYARVRARGQLAILVKRYDRLDNFATLAGTPERFQRKVLRLQRAALPIWLAMDPEGYPPIEAAIVANARRLEQDLSGQYALTICSHCKEQCVVASVEACDMCGKLGCQRCLARFVRDGRLAALWHTGCPAPKRMLL